MYLWQEGHNNGDDDKACTQGTSADFTRKAVTAVSYRLEEQENKCANVPTK